MKQKVIIWCYIDILLLVILVLSIISAWWPLCFAGSEPELLDCEREVCDNTVTTTLVTEPIENSHNDSVEDEW